MAPTRVALGILGMGAVLAALLLGACSSDAPPETRLGVRTVAPAYSEWRALVMAGDTRATNGNPTEGFDNARRDVAAALVRAGFAVERVRTASVQPEKYPGESVLPSDLATVEAALAPGAAGPRGCLLYVTSHGDQAGVIVGDTVLTPAELHAILARQCGESAPVVMIVSACYSGVFAREEMTRWNRFIYTAASAERPSFGCGEADRYPYFDACILEALPASRTFLEMAERATACVEAREVALGLDPSEPQLRIGNGARAALESLPFAGR